MMVTGGNDLNELWRLNVSSQLGHQKSVPLQSISHLNALLAVMNHLCVAKLIAVMHLRDQLVEGLVIAMETVIKNRSAQECLEVVTGVKGETTAGVEVHLAAPLFGAAGHLDLTDLKDPPHLLRLKRRDRRTLGDGHPTSMEGAPNRQRSQQSRKSFVILGIF